MPRKTYTLGAKTKVLDKKGNWIPKPPKPKKRKIGAGPRTKARKY